MATQKKIEYGSAASIIQDLSALYSSIFDHQAALHDEHKYFIREFEQKRGNLDEERAKQALESLNHALRSHEECTAFADTNLGVIAQKVRETVARAHTQVSAEAKHIEHRNKTSADRAETDEKGVKEFLEAQRAERKATDEALQHQLRALSEKYAPHTQSAAAQV